MKQISIVNSKRVTLVDDEDFEWLNAYPWYLLDNKTVQYATTSIDGKTILMHSLLLIVPEGLTVDHKDGEGLNNQKFNLRQATMSQQHANAPKISIKTSSQFKGVYYKSNRDKWVAQIKVNGEHHYLGIHMTEESAAKAYNRAAISYFGEFAQINKF